MQRCILLSHQYSLKIDNNKPGANKLQIRKSVESDLEAILKVERDAFGEEDEAILVRDLLNDPSAEPSVSLLAFDGDRAVGHILFTKLYIEPDTSHALSILAPLAVIPDYQNKGVGGQLIKAGLRHLAEAGVDLVFVLGHPGYYPRHGFLNDAGKLGFEAPYPIPEKDADAWMVQELRAGVIGSFSGKTRCADAMMRPEYWRE